MNKKGSAQDLIMIMVILLVFAVVTLVMFKVTGSFKDQIATMPDIPAEATASTAQLTGVFSTSMDSVFLLLTIGLAIVALVLASMVKVHPIFIVFFLLAWLIIIFLSGVVSNIYAAMAESPALATEAAQLTFISTIMNYLPVIIAVIGILMMIVMHKMGD